MVHRLFAVLLSVLLSFGGGAVWACPAPLGSSSTAAAMVKGAEQPTAQARSAVSGVDAMAVLAPGLALDLAAGLAADDGAVANDDWSASTTAEPLFDVSAMPPLSRHCFASGMRQAPPALPALVLYQPPDLAGPQRPPCALLV